MSKSTISTFELFQMFPDQDSAAAYFERSRWPDGAVCPACGEPKRIGTRKGGFYRCNACLLDFTIRTGTIFERSKIPLHKWLYAMYLLVTARKGISSLQLAKQIGVTQKSAWFMLQRLREACGNDPIELAGIVEIDECDIGRDNEDAGLLSDRAAQALTAADARIAELEEERDLWKQSEEVCSAQHDKLLTENERLRDEVVELWHQAQGEKRELHECLGMDFEQYAAWVSG